MRAKPYLVDEVATPVGGAADEPVGGAALGVAKPAPNGKGKWGGASEKGDAEDEGRRGGWWPQPAGGVAPALLRPRSPERNKRRASPVTFDHRSVPISVWRVTARLPR